MEFFPGKELHAIPCYAFGISLVKSANYFEYFCDVPYFS